MRHAVKIIALVALMLIAGGGVAASGTTVSTGLSVKPGIDAPILVLTRSTCEVTDHIELTPPKDADLGGLCPNFEFTILANCEFACNPSPPILPPPQCSLPAGSTQVDPCICWNKCWYAFLAVCPEFSSGAGGNG